MSNNQIPKSFYTDLEKVLQKHEVYIVSKEHISECKKYSSSTVGFMLLMGPPEWTKRCHFGYFDI